MRRFSQRNSLVTLSEINITPLLDLAFVLLIIFVITARCWSKTLICNSRKTWARRKRNPSTAATSAWSRSGPR